MKFFLKVVGLVAMVLAYVILSPVLLVIRLTDPLRTRRSPAESYWQDHPSHEASVARLKKTS